MTPGLRERIRAEVAGRDPVDDHERESIAAFLAAFDRLPDPFSEDADPVHVTASAVVLGRRNGVSSAEAVVLHRHKRLGLWLQPGGHIDPGELPWDAALREVGEETGLPGTLAAPSGELLHVDVHAGARGHTHLDLRYLVHSPLVPPAPPDGESPDVRWFGWDEALSVADVGLRGLLLTLRPGGM